MQKHRVVVVTDASAGLWRAMVSRFAEDGANAGLMAHGGDRLGNVRFEVDGVLSAAVFSRAGMSIARQSTAPSRAQSRLRVKSDAHSGRQPPLAGEDVPDKTGRSTEIGPLTAQLNDAIGDIDARHACHTRRRCYRRRPSRYGAVDRKLTAGHIAVAISNGSNGSVTREQSVMFVYRQGRTTE